MKPLFTILLILISCVINAQDDTLEVDSGEVDLTPPPPDRLHHFFITVAPGFGRSTHAVLGQHFSELKDCRAEHELDIRVPTAEINVGYHLKTWWNVSAGLQYFETGFDFSELKQLSDTLPYEFSIGCDVYTAVDPRIGFVWYAFYDPRFVSGIRGYHPTSATLKIRERYYYVGLPLKTEFSVLLTGIRGRARLFVNGGVTPNYMIKQLYDMSFNNETWSYVVQDSIGVPAPFVRRWNMTYNVGVGLTFLMKKNYDLRVEAVRQDQLFYFFNWRLWGNFDYQEKHSTSTIRISFRYYFRKK